MSRGLGPLAGITVLEVGGVGPVPFCGMILSDLGADVISLQRPLPAVAPPDDMAFATTGILARGRRSLAVDLKHPDGLATTLALVGHVDALMEGFRPGVMERLGLSPQACLEVNPRLVFGRMTGWGQEGPYAGLPGHDINYLALSGVLAAIGRHDGRPVPPLNLIADFGGGGMLLAVGMVAALLETARSGSGQVVDAAMVDGSGLLMTMMYELLAKQAWTLGRGTNFNDGGAPFYDVYEAADGQWLAVGAMERPFFDRLVQLLELPVEQLPDQWDRERWPQLRAILAERFRSRPRDHWCHLLEHEPVCVTPVLDMAAASAHPHHVARRSFDAVPGGHVPAPAPRFDRTPLQPGPAAVPAGTDTLDVLRQIGMPDQEIERLLANGAVGASPPPLATDASGPSGAPHAP